MVGRLVRLIKKLCSYIVLSVVYKYNILRLYLLTERRERRILYKNFEYRESKDGKEAEKKWRKYWAPILKYPGKWSYRLFSFIDGHDVRILSQVVCSELEKTLNPRIYIPYYDNKNLFDKLLPSSFFPKTLIRLMDGIFIDRDYHIIENISDKTLEAALSGYNSVIIKPTVGSDSGKGIMKFIRSGNIFKSVSDESVVLSINMLQNSGGDSNMILQEALVQHSFMSKFNPTSVNTIRIATYTSPYNGEVNLLSAIIRMGAKGSFVDNMHADGKMVGIDVKTGKLTDFCMDSEGRKYNSYNGIDFECADLYVPEWDKIVAFTVDAASRLFPMKLIQFDVALQEDGSPKLIEFNIGGFPMWVAQYFGFPAFGEWTDEIREYAMKSTRTLKIDILRNIN